MLRYMCSAAVYYECIVLYVYILLNNTVAATVYIELQMRQTLSAVVTG